MLSPSSSTRKLVELRHGLFGKNVAYSPVELTTTRPAAVRSRERTLKVSVVTVAGSTGSEKRTTTSRVRDTSSSALAGEISVMTNDSGTAKVVTTSPPRVLP